MRQIEQVERVLIAAGGGVVTRDLGASGLNLLSFEGETKLVIVELVNNDTVNRVLGVRPTDGSALPTGLMDMSMSANSYRRTIVMLNANNEIDTNLGVATSEAYLVGEVGGDGVVAFSDYQPTVSAFQDEVFRNEDLTSLLGADAGNVEGILVHTY